VKKISSFPLPDGVSGWPNYLKLDQFRIYLTLSGKNFIYLCDYQGKLMQKWGNEIKSSKQGEFHEPTQMSVNEEYFYVCDMENNRVQILEKEDGKFKTQWGQFSSPLSIYYEIEEEIFLYWR